MSPPSASSSRLGVPWPLRLLPGHPVALRAPCPALPHPQDQARAPSLGPQTLQIHIQRRLAAGTLGGSGLPPPPVLSPPKPLLPSRSTRAPAWSLRACVLTPSPGSVRRRGRSWDRMKATRGSRRPAEPGPREGGSRQGSGALMMYVLDVVEAERGSPPRVLQGLRREGLVMAMDEAVNRKRCTVGAGPGHGHLSLQGATMCPCPLHLAKAHPHSLGTRLT